MDFNALKIRMWIFFGSLVFLLVLSGLMASTFDETELKLVGGFAIGFAALLFGKDIKNKML